MLLMLRRFRSIIYDLCNVQDSEMTRRPGMTRVKQNDLVHLCWIYSGGTTMQHSLPICGIFRNYIKSWEIHEKCSRGDLFLYWWVSI